MNIHLLLRAVLISTGLLTILASSGGSDTPAPVADTTPNSFSFQHTTNVIRGSVVTSSQINITGINAPTSITVKMGEYSINNKPFTTIASTITNNDWVRLRHHASNNYGTITTTTLSIGNTSSDFTSTTKLAPVAFKSSITDIDLRSIDKGEKIINRDEVIVGPSITVDY